jgi:threonine dehydrogenase-like Zn-dependent dehydrogenase
VEVRAAVLVAPRQYEIRTYPLPDVAPGAALIRMELAGICGTDKHTCEGYTGQYTGGPKPSSTPFPIIQGHENVGVVEVVNGDVLDFDGQALKEGDRVVVGPNLTCGHCRACTRGRMYTLCENIRDYGNTISASEPPHLFGGWGQYLYALPGTDLFRVPDDLPPEIAVLAEPFAVTASLDLAKQFSALPADPFLFGDTVVVYGTGPLGLLHVLKARLLGAGPIVAIDLSQDRLAFARRFGADHVVDASTLGLDEIVDRVRDVTAGEGADVVVECAGVPSVIPTAIDLLRPGGLFLEVGNFSDLGTVPVSPNRHLCSKGIRLIGIPGQEPGAYGPTLDQLARFQHEYPLADFVSHRFCLDDIDQAVRTSVEPDSLKVVVDPWLDQTSDDPSRRGLL